VKLICETQEPSVLVWIAKRESVNHNIVRKDSPMFFWAGVAYPLRKKRRIHPTEKAAA
jgi:hypothetical protein